MLADPTKSVCDAAYTFWDQYQLYFSKSFKHVVECLPNEYNC